MTIPRPIRGCLRYANGLTPFALLHLALLTLFYWRPLTGEADLYFRDLALYFEPLTRYLGQAVLRDGRLPLWNTGLYSGISQLALGTPNILYPFTWLLALMPFSQGLALYLILHQWAMGVGTFVLVRRLRWGGPAAPLAGMAMAWNGYVLGLQSNFQLVSAAAWIPVLLAALGMKVTLPMAMVTAAATYLLIGTGAPELIVPGLLIAAGWALFLAWESRREQWRQALAVRWGAIGLGLCSASPMILPALEWLQLSNRAGGLETENALLWSAEWYQWLGMMVSHPFGLEAVQVVPRYVDSPFLGAGIMAMAVSGIWRFSSWKVLSFIALLAMACLVCAGETTPVGPWLAEHLPGARVVRYPVKLLFFPLFGFVLAAAKEAGRAGGRQQARSAALRLTIFSLVLAAASMWQVRNPTHIWEWSTTGADKVSILPIFVEEANRNLAVNLFGAMLGVLLLAVVLWTRGKGWLRRRPFCAALVTAATLPLLASACSYERLWAPIGVYSEDRSWPRLRSIVGTWRLLPLTFNDTVAKVSADWLTRRMKEVDRLTEVDFLWISHVRAEQSMLMENSVLDAGISASWGYEATPTGRYLQLRQQAMRITSAAPANAQHPPAVRDDRPLARFCAVTASRYLLLKPEPRPGSGRFFATGSLFRPVWDLEPFNNRGGNPPRLYEVPAARPRAYMTRSVQAAASEESLLRILGAPAEIEFDTVPNHSYVLDRDRETLLRFRATLADGAPGTDALTLLADRGEEIHYRARTEKGGLFVLADQYYPGWEATVDNQATEILQVNLVNRGVLLQAGDHTISMRYRPRSLQTGLAVFVAGVLLFAGSWWWLVAGKSPKVATA